MLLIGCKALEATTDELGYGKSGETSRDLHTANTSLKNFRMGRLGNAGKEGNPC